MITRHNNFDNRKEFFINFIFALVAFYFIFSAALNIPFYHHDIYKFSTGSLHRACTGNQGYKLLMALGRPGSAYIDCVNNKIGNTLESYNILRALCLGLVSLMVSLFAGFLQPLGFSRWTAFLVSATIFLLPLTYTTVIMASGPLIVAMLLAYLAYLLISKLNVEKQTLHLNNVMPVVLGLILLLASFFTYPAVTPFYLVPALTLVLFKPLAEWRHTKKIVLRDLFIYSVFSIVYFVAARQLQEFMKAGIPAGYKIQINTHLLRKMEYLLFDLPKLWNIEAGRGQAYLVYSVMTLGCLCGLKAYFNETSKISRSLVAAVLSVLIILLFASTVYLASPTMDAPFTRVIFPFQAIVALILFWSALYICKLVPHKQTQAFLCVTMLMFALAAFFANQMVTRSVLNDYHELNVIINALSQRIQSHQPIKRVHIIASRQVNYTGYIQHEDIFNINSSFFGDDSANMVNAAFLRIANRHSFDITNCYFGENTAKTSPKVINCISTLPDENIAVTFSRPGQEIYQSPATLVIDMSSSYTPGEFYNFNERQQLKR